MGRPRRSSHNVRRVWRQVENLSIEELLDLKRLVLDATKGSDEEEGGAGVREPRPPKKPAPREAAIVLGNLGKISDEDV